MKRSRSFRNMLNKLTEKTGEQCFKHSLSVKENMGRTSYDLKEVVPFDEELGSYPIDILRNTKTGSVYCPECRKERTIERESEMILKAEQGHRLETTSKMLKNKSLLVDSTIKEATFETFRVTDEATKALKEKAVNIVSSILSGDTNNYLLVGEVGRGKSHLAMAILDRVNKDSYKQGKARSCVFISIHAMISKIHNGYGLSDLEYQTYRYTDNYFKELANRVDVLVLDDLGSELGQINSKTEASDSVTKILNAILEARQGKVTIITTNLSENRIKLAYGDRIESRLKDGLENNAILFTGTNDKRVNKPI